MFKKIISMAMVLVMMTGVAVTANAVCDSEEGRPCVIGVEHIDAVLALDEEDVVAEYSIEMTHAEGYWVVVLEGIADVYEDYYAVGFYSHYPTAEEIDVLWANRMLEDEISEILEKLGI